MAYIDQWRPSENCGANQSTWFMREPPILIEPEKAYYHLSADLHPSHKASSPREAMSNRSIVPHENDVLMGRGGKNNQHSGNEKLRTLARIECENYRLASKKGKSYISRELVKKVRELEPPGRFLKKNQKSGDWEDVGDEVGREKASQVLRDAVSALSGQAAAPGVSKNVSESAESSDHEGQHHEHEHQSDAARKRQRSESASTLEWPAPPRMLAVGAPLTKQHQLQPEAYPITPVSPTTKRQRTVYYQQETYSPDRQLSPSNSPYTRHSSEATVDHTQAPPLPPPPPPLHHYAHHHPSHRQHQHHQQQPQQIHMQHQQQYPYEYSVPMPPPSRTEYSVPPIPLRPHSGYPPPRGYPTAVWTGGYASAPPLPAPTDVNEFELFQGELLESDDEGKHPDIQRSDSF